MKLSELKLPIGCRACAVLLSILWSVPSISQAQDSKAPEDAADEAPTSQGASGEEKSEEVKRLAEQVESLQSRLEEQDSVVEDLSLGLKAQKEQSEKLEQQLEDSRAAIEQVRDDQQFDQAAWDRLLRVYGFFDVTFMKAFYGKESVYNLWFERTPSFTMSDLNLYFDSQMTEDIRALVELHFTFAPRGLTENFGFGYEDQNGDLVVVQPHTRNRDEYIDPFTTRVVPLNGVAIERANLTWAPRDWFGITAGRFLTPYGIWNIDHGPTVVIPARMPYMHQRQVIPRAQTGLMAHGRFYPTSRFTVEYALTLSNGLGLKEALFDLDNNKAVGLRLKGSYDRGDLKVALGGYGMYGTWADLTETIVHQADADSVRVVEVPYDTSREIMFSADFKLEFSGLLLQSEWVSQTTLYKEPPKMEVANLDRYLKTGDLDETHEYYRASMVGHAVYGLLGYEYRLERLGRIRIVPYLMLQWNKTNDTMPHWDQKGISGGLNLRPISQVVFKLEYGYFRPNRQFYSTDFQNIVAQLAVSF